MRQGTQTLKVLAYVPEVKGRLKAHGIAQKRAVGSTTLRMIGNYTHASPKKYLKPAMSATSSRAMTRTRKCKQS